MPAIVVVGTQWGDEGKGKIVDALAEQSHIVVRFQGGANAGHTLIHSGQTFVLHLIPSGILHRKNQCLIGAGVALDLELLCLELKGLEKRDILLKNKQLLISDMATVLLPHHRLIDRERENRAIKGKTFIGTTQKGIGPAYEDRVARRALIFKDIFLEDKLLKGKLERSLMERKYLLETLYKLKPVNREGSKGGSKNKNQLKELQNLETGFLLRFIKKHRKKLENHRCSDVSLFVHNALKERKTVLFESAQGAMLDILQGTYPFVTSSSTLAGSVCTGVGIGPKSIHKVLGVMKAYTTRVGEGPFPTELKNGIGMRLQQKGGEKGATTGRPRRCGWLDLVALKYAIRINGIDALAITKLDVLTGFGEIGVCTAYKKGGKFFREFPLGEDLSQFEPHIKMFSGWDKGLNSLASRSELPRGVIQLLDFIRTQTDTPIDLVSLGPERNQTLWIKPLLDGSTPICGDS